LLNNGTKIINTDAIHDQMYDSAMDERGRQNPVILLVFADLKTAKKQIIGNFGISHGAKIYQGDKCN
jgi:hypothetical protein